MPRHQQHPTYDHATLEKLRQMRRDRRHQLQDTAARVIVFTAGAAIVWWVTR